ncbi:MAG: hypothetical protein CM15mP120_13630 [Pseudomonadota bacterium]|nr:MAG: hypothetical protein CM15mP120_13630 [Pseudomonadota bacterium]
MYSFQYHAPTSLAEANTLFTQADDPIYIAGGMTLIPSMKQRLAQPSDVIDLAAVDELRGVSVTQTSLWWGADYTQPGGRASSPWQRIACFG